MWSDVLRVSSLQISELGFDVFVALQAVSGTTAGHCLLKLPEDHETFRLLNSDIFHEVILFGTLEVDISPKFPSQWLTMVEHLLKL